MTTKSRNTEIFRLGDLPSRVYGRVAGLPKTVVAGGREAWLTGLGAVAVLEQQGGKLVDTVVEGRESLAKKGAHLEKRGKLRIEETRDELAERREQVVTRAGTLVTEPLAGAMKRLGVPTREEVQELSHKVDLLTRKLNTLIKALDKANEPTVVEHA